MVQAVLFIPVVLLLFLGTIDLGQVMYYKAQTRSAATAGALAAVGTQKLLPVPIPTKIVWLGFVPIPVDGFVFNTIRLPNADVEARVFTTDAENPVKRVASLTGHGQITTEVTKVLPWAWPAPFKWVKVTATAPTPGILTRIVMKDQIESSACAIAWVRPDYWFIESWWTPKALDTLIAVFEDDDEALLPGEEPLHYYRQVSCDVEGAGQALEVVLEAQYGKDTAEKQKYAQKFTYIDNSKKNRLDKTAGKQSSKGVKHSIKADMHIPDLNSLKDCASHQDGETGCRGNPVQILTCPDGTMITYRAPVAEGDPPDTSKFPTRDQVIREQCPPPTPPKSAN
ncbi:MAG TPA: TadE family protein [Symbiobacteriaceae bacterium]|jgi:hypothetical protein